ncbi:MAG TPA: hypothetical protein PLF90_04465 [bacterium]|nr:hypothetical protein [bacterium]
MNKEEKRYRVLKSFFYGWISIIVVNEIMRRLLISKFLDEQRKFLTTYPTQLLDTLVIYFSFSLCQKHLISSFLTFMIGSLIMAYFIGEKGWIYSIFLIFPASALIQIYSFFAVDILKLTFKAKFLEVKTSLFLGLFTSLLVIFLSIVIGGFLGTSLKFIQLKVKDYKR